MVVKKFNPEDFPKDLKFNYNPEETKELHELMNGNSNLTIDHLRRISLWKLNRVLNVPDELIKKLEIVVADSDLSLDSTGVKEILGDLIECDGVGMPMASSFLKFLRPDVFPIIDVRAYRVLYGKKIYSSQYSVDKYLEYAKKIKSISAILEKPLNEIDELLYVYDKDFNGKI